MVLPSPQFFKAHVSPIVCVTWGYKTSPAQRPETTSITGAALFPSFPPPLFLLHFFPRRRRREKVVFWNPSLRLCIRIADIVKFS